VSSPIFNQLLALLNKLEQEKISYSLAHHRDEAMLVSIAIPGERWEVEFLSDGSVEVEKFISHGEIAGEEALGELFDQALKSENTVEWSTAINHVRPIRTG
jgi:hypothetical protein